MSLRAIGPTNIVATDFNPLPSARFIFYTILLSDLLVYEPIGSTFNYFEPAFSIKQTA